jgi:hypothetical protein
MTDVSHYDDCFISGENAYKVVATLVGPHTLEPPNNDKKSGGAGVPLMRANSAPVVFKDKILKISRSPVQPTAAATAATATTTATTATAATTKAAAAAPVLSFLLDFTGLFALLVQQHTYGRLGSCPPLGRVAYGENGEVYAVYLLYWYKKYRY